MIVIAAGEVCCRSNTDKRMVLVGTPNQPTPSAFHEGVGMKQHRTSEPRLGEWASSRFVWQPYEKRRHCYLAPSMPYGERITALCGSEIISHKSSSGEWSYLTCSDCNAAVRNLQGLETLSEVRQ